MNNKTKTVKIRLLITLFLLLSTYVSSFSADNKWVSSGIGVSLFSSGVNKDFHQFELYAMRNLTGSRQIMPGLKLKARLNTHAGLIRVKDENAFFFSIGPCPVLSFYNEKILSCFGINPTLISRKDFYDIHLGGPLQFTIYAEIDVNINSAAGIGFRTQHTSNANIYKENHGFNTYMFLMNYSFSRKACG